MLTAAVLLPAYGAPDVAATARAIRTEALMANAGEEGQPLPLATAWCTGSHRWSTGWRPIHQLALIERGHFLLPWFAHPSRGQELDEKGEAAFKDYYEAAVRRAAELKLPLTFVSTQWESLLSRPPWVDLPADQNPNVVGVDGKIAKKVSPFGPVAPWREVGRSWTDSARMRLLQEWYPDPPRVIFLSNNEHGKLRWHKAETSSRYMKTYGTGRSADFKRKVVGDGWIERYRALQGGMRTGLVSPKWRQAARFVGYGGGAPEFLGRWGGWVHYSLHTKGRINPYPAMWDGSSPSYYTHDWCPTTDHTTWSPQLEFMNTVFAKQLGYKLNPDWWYEFSTWDGHEWPWRKKTPSKVMVYEQADQVWNPERYEGFIQFGMWLMRPRAVREYRGWTTPWDKAEPYFLAISSAVDRVHRNATLRQWWRHGELVPNRARKHPYQSGIPAELQDVDRWFLLDCDVNPQEFPWDLHWKIPVFALARTIGEKPNRRWLVYAHAPLGERQAVKVTVPEYTDITIDVPPVGVFCEIDEATDAVKRVPLGTPLP